MNMPRWFLVALFLFMSPAGGVLAAQEDNPCSAVLEERTVTALAITPN